MEVVYTSNPQNSRQSGEGEPTEWVPIYEMVLEPYTEEVNIDVDGRPIVNGAGDPYDTAVTIEKDIIRYDFYQYEPANTSDLTIAQRNNKVNDAKFREFEAGTLRLKVRKSAVGFYYGRQCRLVEYSVLWKEDKWFLELPNVGQAFCDSTYKRHPYRYKTSPNKVLTGPLGNQNYTISGNSTTKHNFKGTGGHLPSYGIENGHNPEEKFSVNPVTTTNGIDKPIYTIQYRVYKNANFSQFLR